MRTLRALLLFDCADEVCCPSVPRVRKVWVTTSCRLVAGWIESCLPRTRRCCRRCRRRAARSRKAQCTRSTGSKGLVVEEEEEELMERLVERLVVVVQLEVVSLQV